MGNLTDRTSYLRGLAEGLSLDKEKAENRLMLEMLNVMDEIAHKVQDLDEDMDELNDYVESIDDDFSDMEDLLFGEEDGCDCDECEDEDEDDEEGDDDLDDNEELSFECPHCGKDLQIKASDIDFDQSPTCPNCHKPFFPDVIDGEDNGDDDKGTKK